VRNNPLKYVDPSGHIPIPMITGAIGGLIGGVAGAGLYAWSVGGNINGEDMLLAAGAGAVSGALIGSGAALIGAAVGTAGAVSAGTVTASTMLIGAGSGMGAAGAGQLVSNGFTETPFNKNAFIATTGSNLIGGAVKGSPIGRTAAGRVVADAATGVADSVLENVLSGEPVDRERAVAYSGIYAASFILGERITKKPSQSLIQAPNSQPGGSTIFPQTRPTIGSILIHDKSTESVKSTFLSAFVTSAANIVCSASNPCGR
jgi:hypothetical protein